MGERRAAPDEAFEERAARLTNRVMVGALLVVGLVGGLWGVAAEFSAAATMLDGLSARGERALGGLVVFAAAAFTCGVQLLGRANDLLRAREARRAAADTPRP